MLGERACDAKFRAQRSPRAGRGIEYRHRRAVFQSAFANGRSGEIAKGAEKK
jgi:hypothetical protein